MNKKLQLSVLIAVMSVTGAYGDTVPNEFVKEKRVKKVSTARMREEIGETLAQSLVRSTEILEALPKLQREYMQMLEVLMSQPKESKLTQADRIGLDKTIDIIANLECNLTAMHKQLQDSIEVVKKQY